jgi:protein transport protein SEC31
MKLYEIQRTATFAWSPHYLQPNQQLLLATGSVSGALDASFSSHSELELFSLDVSRAGQVEATKGESPGVKRVAKVTTPAR